MAWLFYALLTLLANNPPSDVQPTTIDGDGAARALCTTAPPPPQRCSDRCRKSSSRRYASL
jgi:hypothetical protein